MRKILAIVYILFLISDSLFAQNNVLLLKGKVLDYRTRKDVVNTTLQILNEDSVILDCTTASNHCMEGDREWYQADFHLKVPRTENTAYIIRATMMGYKPYEQRISVGKIPKNRNIMEIDPVLLKEDAKALDEVVVSATKVKFYYRGDTLVYNADAFMLSEGSMLDALVRQLPGAEIKANGDIYHNGKLVRELLLNGKDFFRSNQKIMLDNLPTYMVKQVEVYDKQTEKSEFLGDTTMKGKQYVMDVRLKKNYSVGWIANIEAGSGVAGNDADNIPYMGRLFALRFTDHSRMGIYVNANNLNDERKPGQDDQWTPSGMKEGVKEEQMAGIDYNIDERNRKWNLRGEANFSHNILNNEQQMQRTNFFETGNTFEKVISAEQKKNLFLESNHNFRFTLNRIMLTVRPNVEFRKYDFSSNMESMSWGNKLINRYYKLGLMKGHELKGRVNMNSTIKFADSSDYLDVSAQFSYQNRKDDTFNRYSLYNNEDITASKYSDQYYKNHPDKDYSANVSLAYNHALGKDFYLSLKYDATLQNKEKHSSLYLLDKMEDYEQGDIGILPSVMDYVGVCDLRNSFISDEDEMSHALTPNISYQKTTKGGHWYGELRPTITLKHRKLDYVRGEVDTAIVQTIPFFGIYDTFLTWASVDNKRCWGLWYTLDTKLPDMINMVDMHDDTDPLNIREGNGNLKSSMAHTIRMVWMDNRIFSQSLRLDFNMANNALSMGCFYDSNTGIRTWKAYNVNGNWRTGGSYTTGVDIGKAKLFHLDSSTRFYHNRNVDMSGNNEVNGVVRSIVYTENIGQELNLTYRRGENSISLGGDVDYRHVGSKQENFKDLDIWHFRYGLHGIMALPLGVQFSTDLTMYSRRGYGDKNLNANELVWNARLSKSVMKGSLVFMLDGYDILGNLSNVTQTVNGQGRTELRTNVLPQYVMFHIQYKFNKQPSK